MPVPEEIRRSTAGDDKPRLAAVLALVLTLAGLALLAPAAARAQSPRAVLAFLPRGGDDNPAPVIDRLDERTELALGLVSATQGSYTPEQTLLDISDGSRTSPNVYDPRQAPHMELVVGGDGSGFIFGWSKARRRAATALAEIEPGALAGQIPGGAGYAGVRGRTNLEAVAAADRTGDVAEVSLGPAASLGARVGDLLRRHRLVVTGLPTAAKGDAVLDALLRDRRPGDVLIVMQTPPRAFVPQLLPGAAVLPASPSGVLTSPTTRLPGIVAAIDIPVTILRRLKLAIPRGVKGQPIHVEGTRDANALRTIEARLRVVSGRRIPTLFAIVFTWAALLLALGLLADRRGIRAGMRIGALAVLWVPSLLLLTGYLAPVRLAEVSIVVGGSFGLGALTDRAVRWPRGPLLPAAVALAAYGVDLALGSENIVRSLLGANPRSGTRFYGLGNELESTLVVLLFVVLAIALMRPADVTRDAPFGSGPGRSRRAVAIVGAAGVVAAVFVGAGQLGADVGGVITIGGGIAVMGLLMAPGTPTRRTIALALLVPFAAVAGLALLDLATGGNGHFTRTVLHADSVGALWDTVVRRYTLAFNNLKNGVMPFVTALALLAVAYAVRYRDRIYAPLGGSPAWRAALAGGLAASVVGALFNDSGPILLVFGVFVLACVTVYVRGDPRLADDGRTG
ncbi:MAG: hypothetical protein QOE31_2145 [Solirubrobacteraceae bacterium]|jgi:hypothetical protein|nr:hypothetical protein [Solirubrobacteraceae bacterium]